MMSTKKYGLIIKKKVQDNQVKKSSIFGNDSSEEEDDKAKRGVNVSLMREAEKKKQMKQTQIEIEKALKEDPTVYEYDNIYDDMAKKKEAAIPKLTEKDKKPKYIQNLLKSAKARKMEEERRLERKTQKEREQEGGEFQDKEEFVTSAYRKRMLELEEEEKRLREQDAIDARNDVTKRSDLSMFYSNLLKHNVSMGGAFAAEQAKVDHEAGKIDKNKDEGDLDKSQKSKEKHTENTRDTKFREESPSKDESRGRLKQTRDNDRRERRENEGQRHREESRKHSRHHHERRRDDSSDDEQNYRRRDDHRDKDRKRSHKDIDRHSESTRDDRRKHEEERSKIEETQRHKPDEASKQEEKKDKTKQENAASSKFVKRSNDETISSAKQRYLERKRAREMALQSRKTDDSDED